VQNLDLERAKRDALAIHEQPVEVASVGSEVGRIKDRAEDLLDLANVLADANLRAGPALDIGRTAQVIGMRVRLECPNDAKALGSGSLQHRVGRARVNLARGEIEIQHRVDDRSCARLGIPHKVGDGLGRLVEKGADFELRCHSGASPKLTAQYCRIYMILL